jgi:anthranilate synthase component 1
LAADGARPVDELLVEPPGATDELPEVHSTMGADLYGRAVEVAREHILAGDIFQVVLSQRFDFDLGAEPFDVYRVLRQVNPSHARLAGELREHPKEIAEHVMLVDRARNDVGRVVRFGTEQVDEYLTLERYSHVMHLTSQVSGRLAEGKTAIDVLRATLPATSTSPATSTRPSPSARWWSTTRAGRRSRRGRASSPTRFPSTRTSSAATRPGRCWPRSRPPGG